ncbi:MAG: hypothetical protein ACRDHU_01760 [Actinomycetota bacterium]
MADLASKDDFAAVGEAVIALLRRALPFVQQSVGGVVLPGAEETVYVQGQGEWTQGMVQRLKEALTYPAPVTLLDMTAATPDQTVKFTDLCERAGLPPKQVAAELGAMSKLSRKLFDGEKIWPIRWWQDSSDNITRYVMQRRIAEWWRQA